MNYPPQVGEEAVKIKATEITNKTDLNVCEVAL